MYEFIIMENVRVTIGNIRFKAKESERNLFLKFSVFRHFKATKLNYEYAKSNDSAYRSYCYKSFHRVLILIFI